MGARRLRATASRENGQALEKARRACQRWRRFGFGAPPDWGWGRAGLGSTEPCYTVNAIRARLIFRRRRPLGRPLGRFGLFRAPFGSSRMKIAATLASPGASHTALCRAVGPDDGMAAAVEPKDGQAGAGREDLWFRCRRVGSTPRCWSPSRKTRRPRLPVWRRISLTAPRLNRGDLQACTRGSPLNLLCALRKLL